MTEIKTEIICKDFKQMNIIQEKIYTNEQREEYYIIPLNKKYTMEYNDEIYKLTFHNQLLWLKYSTNKKYILLNEYPYRECVIIKSKDILDIYCQIATDNYEIKKTWQSNNVHTKKQNIGKHCLVISIIDEMVNVSDFGTTGRFHQIEVITNEVLLKEVKRRSENGG